jgi:hypothetical protein
MKLPNRLIIEEELKVFQKLLNHLHLMLIDNKLIKWKLNVLVMSYVLRAI